MVAANSLFGFKTNVDGSSEDLLDLLVSIVVRIGNNSEKYSQIIRVEHKQIDLGVDGLFENVEEPLVKHVIRPEALEAYYKEFIAKIPDDTNRKLILELVFLRTLSLFEKLVLSAGPPADGEAERKAKTDFKLDFLSVCLDFSNYLVNETQDAQSDLTFILINKTTESNSVEFIRQFWLYMESRRYELVRFASLNSNAYYVRGRGSLSAIKNRNLLGVRRPGSVLLKLVNRIRARVESRKASNVVLDAELLGRLKVYLADMFAISDVSLDNGFLFNDSPEAPVGKRQGEGLFARFAQLQQWLANPITDKIGSTKQEYILKDQFDIAEEFIRISLQKLDERTADNSAPNKISNDLKLFVQTGELAHIGDFYVRKLYQDKLEHYRSVDHGPSLLTRFVDKETFQEQKHQDRLFRLHVLMQIYIVASFLLGQVEKHKREDHTQFTEYAKQLNAFIARRKQPEDDIQPIELMPYLKFRAVFPTLTRVDLEYYMSLKKTIGLFFEKYDKSLYFTATSLTGSQEMIWFYWKLSQFRLFNFLPNTESFNLELKLLVESKLLEFKKYDSPFAIQYGNRNLTKVFTAKHQLSVESGNNNAMENHSKLKQQLADFPSELVRNQYNLSCWKKSRLVRKQGGWLGISASDILPHGAETTEIAEPRSVREQTNESLKRKVEELTKYNADLVQSNNKRLKTRYISLSKDEDENDKPNNDSTMVPANNDTEALEY